MVTGVTRVTMVCRGKGCSDNVIAVVIAVVIFFFQGEVRTMVSHSSPSEPHKPLTTGEVPGQAHAPTNTRGFSRVSG